MVHYSISAYLSSYLYHQPGPPRISKISKNPPRSRPPGTKTFYLSDNYQTKPRSKRQIPCVGIGEGEYMLHFSSSSYLSSYVYHQPLPKSRKSRKICPQVPGQTVPPELETCFVHGRRRMYGSLQQFRILVELFISPSPPRISKISKICPERRPPRTRTFYLSDKYQFKPRSKRQIPCVGIGEGKYMVHISSSAYLSSYLYLQPLPESQKSRKIRPERPPSEIHNDSYYVATCRAALR